MQYLGQHLCLLKHPSSDIYGTGNFGDKGCKTAGVDSLIALKTLNATQLLDVVEGQFGTSQTQQSPAYHCTNESAISFIDEKEMQMTGICSLSAFFLASVQSQCAVRIHGIL